MGRRVRRPACAGGGVTTRRRARANGEGSIFPRGNGFAAYVWVTTPAGKRTRKYVYGADRETVHRKWVELHRVAAQRTDCDAGADCGRVARNLARRGGRTESCAGDRGQLRDVRPALHRSSPRREATRPTVGAGSPAVAQQSPGGMPVLRSRQGRQPPGEPAAVLCNRSMLRVDAIGSIGHRRTGRPAISTEQRHDAGAHPPQSGSARQAAGSAQEAAEGLDDRAGADLPRVR